MKILLINQNGANFGDDAAGAAAIYQLRSRFQNCCFSIVYNYPRASAGPILPLEGVEAEHYLGLDPNEFDLILVVVAQVLPIRWFFPWLSESARKVISLADSADVVLMSPCGANIGVYRDWRSLIRLLLVAACGRAPVFCLNTIGRSGNIVFDLLAKHILSKSVVFVREKRSFDFARSIGVGANVGVDTVFGLPLLSPAQKRKEVAVILTDVTRWFPSFQRYKMAEFRGEVCRAIASVAIQNGLSVRLLPHTHSFANEDEFLLGVLAELREFMGDGVSYDRECRSFVDYETAIAQSMIVVSMRYHGIVMSARNGVPFVALSYENKMREVAAYVGCGETVLDLRHWSEAKFTSIMRVVMENSDKIRLEMKARAPALTRLAQLPYDYVWLVSN